MTSDIIARILLSFIGFIPFVLGDDATFSKSSEIPSRWLPQGPGQTSMLDRRGCLCHGLACESEEQSPKDRRHFRCPIAQRSRSLSSMKQTFCLLALMVAAARICPSQTVVNGSFETGATPPFGGAFIPAPDSTSIPGWTVQSGSVDYIGSDTWQAADGSRSLDMSGHD